VVAGRRPESARRLRVALLCPVERGGLQVSADQLIVLAALNAGLLILGSMATTEYGKAWAIFSALSLVPWVSLFLLLGYLIARIERGRVRPLSLPVIGFATYPWFLALGLLVAKLGLVAPKFQLQQLERRFSARAPS
jgi:hypothetical protein